jgi:hypothetical protein
MTAPLVLHDRVQTPIAFVDLVALLGSTFAAATLAAGGPTTRPPPELLASAAAIVGVENGGGVLIDNNNLGHLSASEGDVYANQHAGGPAYFAHFDTPEAGAETFWRWWLYRYRDSALAGLAGNVELAVRELYRLGYVVGVRPGEMADYERGARAFYRKGWGSALDQGAPRERTIGQAIAAPLALGALGALGMVLR